MKFSTSILLFITIKSFALTNINEATFTSFDGTRLKAKVYSSHKKTKLPGILIIEGSGKSGFVKEPEGSPFNELAKVLAERGFVVLKYNKRGSGENSKNGSFWKSTFNSDNQDAESALNLLKTMPHVDSSKLYLIGHSFGGPQALLLSTKVKIAGVVMLTSTIRPTDELLLEQNSIIMTLQEIHQEKINKYLETFKSDLAKIKAGTYKCESPNCTMIDETAIYESTIQVPWLKEVLNMNFANLAKSLSSPILFIFGSNDAIIPETDFMFAKREFEKTKSSVEIKMISKLDHFMVENESKKESLSYATQAQKSKIFKPISKQLVNTIVKWIDK